MRWIRFTAIAFLLAFSPTLLAVPLPDFVPNRFLPGFNRVPGTSKWNVEEKNLITGNKDLDELSQLYQVESFSSLFTPAFEGGPFHTCYEAKFNDHAGLEKTSTTDEFQTSVYSGMGWGFPALTLHHDYLYVNSVFDGVYTFRIDDDLTISQLDEHADPLTDILWHIDANDDFLFAQNGETLGLYSLDNPEQPQLIQTSYAPSAGAVDRVFLSDTFALMMMPSPLNDTPDSALQLVSFDDPANVVVHSTILSEDYPYCAAIPPTRPDLLIFGFMGRVYDISDPSDPVTLVESTPDFGIFRCWGEQLVCCDGTEEELNFWLWDIQTDGTLESVLQFTGPPASSGFVELETSGNMLAVMNLDEVRLFRKTTGGVEELYSRALGFTPSSLDINENVLAVTGSDTLLVVGLEGMHASEWHANSIGSYQLLPCYPNPFNSATMIRFELNSAGHVQISVHDILGREINHLLDGQMESGRHSVSWTPSQLSSGTYFVRMSTNRTVKTRKVVYLK